MEFFVEYSINFINFMNGIIKTLIPLSFTIFIFAYREQKEVAYSLFKRKKALPIKLFLGITLLLVIFNMFLIPDATATGKLSDFVIVCLAIISFAWIVIAYFAYKSILRNINVISEFEYNINQIKKGFENIEKEFDSKEDWTKNNHAFVAKLQKELKEINIASEICFQILTAKDKYKLSNDFTHSYKSIDEVLIKKIIDINLNEEKFSKIVPFSGTLYFDLYISTLKCMNDLLGITFKGGKDTEINSIIDNLGKIQPLSFVLHKDLKREWKVYRQKKRYSNHKDLESLFKDFYDEYYCIICQVILTLYQNNDNRTSRIFRSLILRESERQNTNKNDFLTLITSLFIKALHQNNIKLLTDVTNTFLDLLNEFKSPKNPTSMSIIGNRIKMKRFERNLKKHYDVQEKISRVMFLGIVKSIELGHYQCAGFLIKNFVKNFNYNDITYLIEETYRNIENKHPNLGLSKNLTELLSTKITFSATSYKYCFLKATLLVSIQQYYTCAIKKVRVEPNKLAFISLDYFFKDEDYEYLSYLKSKIKGLNSLYGLLALEEKNLKKFYKANDL
ncbi:hypothetical protein [Bacillus thuringiensis]|uniref:hypothetical protein n=1 Tax=Bacillus thuringiensis TaxID=1428 RepID=UPI002E179842|nr:hypothetical protein [Bacillus thuringiensis]